jgi:multidrug efflux pump subunit AcrA (membrane-fusion protein)
MVPINRVVVMSLFELRDRILMLPSLESRMLFLLKESKKAEIDVAILLEQYKRESRDVERIQKASFSAFLFKVIRKYDNKLEKEQLEEISAKLAYDRAVTHLDSLVHEKEELSSRILALQAEKQTYQAELASRRRELKEQQLTEQKGVQYAKLEDERSSIVSQITEIKEALSAAARVKNTAKIILESLNNAENWATYDIFARGGIISHMKKYSHVDSAEQNFHILSSQLRDLKTELNDVHNLTMPELNEISSAQRTIDFWFDNIFTDLSVRRQIKDNSEQIRHLLNNINTIESVLNSKLKQKETEFTKNRQTEEELLLSMY